MSANAIGSTFVGLLVRFRRRLVVVPVLVAAFVALVTLLLPRHYTATVSIVPQVSNLGVGGSSISSLAAQFGVTMPSNDLAQSPAFYAKLFQTNDILNIVASSQFFRIEKGRIVRGSFADVMNIGGDTPPIRLHNAVVALQLKTKATLEPSTGIVTVSATMPTPELALEVVRDLLSQVQEFNVRSRQEMNGAQAEFFAGRFDKARRELRDAEDSLENFVARNRSFDNDPRLSVEHDRLEREVSRLQSVYLNISNAYEQARIQAAQATPLVTVIDAPVVPAVPDRRRLILKTVAAALIAFVVFLMWLLAVASWSVRSTADPEIGAGVAELGRLAYHDWTILIRGVRGRR